MIPGIIAQVGSGSGDGPSERWWRIRFANQNSGGANGVSGDAYFDLYQAGLYTVAGGPNLIAQATEFKARPAGAPPSALLANFNGGIRWNNAGIQKLNQDCWIAFKLPTVLPINRFMIQSGGTYGQFDMFLESSWDGVTWEFEYGYCRETGGGQRFYDRLNIDWSTATYRDWLLQPQNIYNYTNLGLMEVEMASEIGGPDLCNGGTPRSTGNGTYPAANAFDNNLNSLCGSNGYGRQAHVGYTFPEPVNIQEVRYYPHPGERPDWSCLCAGLGAAGTYSGPWYVKQVFEGSEIRDMAPHWVNLDARNPRMPTPGAHRYWRIRPTQETFTGGSQGAFWNSFAFSKIDFRAGGASIPLAGGTAICGNYVNGDWTPDKAFDGNPATAWHSDTVTQRTWVGYAFVDPVSPDELRLTPRTDGVNERLWWPREFVVEFSDNGATWWPSKWFASPQPTPDFAEVVFPLAA